MKRLGSKLTYSNVVSTLCLVLLLGGGTALAATKLDKNSVGSRQLKAAAVTAAKIKDGAVTGAKLAPGTLGTVPSATNATHASNADNATHATSATTAASADTAGLADNANALGGSPSGAFARSALEAIHVFRAAGQPAFENGCVAQNTDIFGQPGFYKDGFGIVHFVGLLEGCTPGSSMFTLPAGFRPSADNLMIVATGETTSGEISVLPDGEVKVFGGTQPRLFGLTFRAEQ